MLTYSKVKWQITFYEEKKISWNYIRFIISKNLLLYDIQEFLKELISIEFERMCGEKNIYCSINVYLIWIRRVEIIYYLTSR